MKFNILLKKADEGGYNVTVPALDGYFTQGATEEEAIRNAKESIICYLEGLEKVNQKIISLRRLKFCFKNYLIVDV